MSPSAADAITHARAAVRFPTGCLAPVLTPLLEWHLNSSDGPRIIVSAFRPSPIITDGFGFLLRRRIRHVPPPCRSSNRFGLWAYSMLNDWNSAFTYAGELYNKNCDKPVDASSFSDSTTSAFSTKGGTNRTAKFCGPSICQYQPKHSESHEFNIDRVLRRRRQCCC